MNRFLMSVLFGFGLCLGLASSAFGDEKIREIEATPEDLFALLNEESATMPQINEPSRWIGFDYYRAGNNPFKLSISDEVQDLDFEIESKVTNFRKDGTPEKTDQLILLAGPSFQRTLIPFTPDAKSRALVSESTNANPKFTTKIILRSLKTPGGEVLLFHRVTEHEIDGETVKDESIGIYTRDPQGPQAKHRPVSNLN